MTTISYWHWFLVLLILTIPIPVGKLLRKTGRSRWWALIYFFPVINILALWIWAFTSTPTTDANN